jgi:glutamyl-tRNA synthetase
MIPEEAQWLTGDNVSEVIIQSDRIPLYYDYVEKFIEKEAVYICICDPEEYKDKLSRSVACPCRNLPKEEQSARWNKMLDGTYKPGDAVVRLKTDIDHKNPAMRDFPLARINETEHPRQGKKYRVWPLMNLSVFADDVESGMTHTLRGKDHADNAKRQQCMYDYLDLKSPYTFFQGRINFFDLQVSCSKTKKLIEEGQYTGWRDIRLPFLAALKRRGYQPGAFVKWAADMGASLTDKKVSGKEAFKNIDALNKDILEPMAKRFFFVADPVNIRIEGAKEQHVELDLHPDNIKGGRKLVSKDSFLISEDDYSRMKPDTISRLMDCLNFIHKPDSIGFHSGDYEAFKDNGGCSIIHWLPDDSSQIVDTEVLMPDMAVISGKAERNIEQLEIGDVIQFERFGFCRLDSKKDGKYTFWFTHK